MFSLRMSARSTKSLILIDIKITLMRRPGIIISGYPSPADTFSLIIIAPRRPYAIYSRFPILNSVFSSSIVRIVVLLSGFFCPPPPAPPPSTPSSSSSMVGLSGFLRGSSARVLIIPICFYIGTITMVSVSLENVKDAAVSMMQVKIVVANCNCASATVESEVS